MLNKLEVFIIFIYIALKIYDKPSLIYFSWNKIFNELFYPFDEINIILVLFVVFIFYFIFEGIKNKILSIFIMFFFYIKCIFYFFPFYIDVFFSPDIILYLFFFSFWDLFLIFIVYFFSKNKSWNEFVVEFLNLLNVHFYFLICILYYSVIFWFLNNDFYFFNVVFSKTTLIINNNFWYSFFKSLQLDLNFPLFYLFILFIYIFFFILFLYVENKSIYFFIFIFLNFLLGFILYFNLKAENTFVLFDLSFIRLEKILTPEDKYNFIKQILVFEDPLYKYPSYYSKWDYDFLLKTVNNIDDTVKIKNIVLDYIKIKNQLRYSWFFRFFI